MTDPWNITPTEIAISRGGKVPGCVVVILVILGLGFIVVGVLVCLTVIDIPSINNSMPIWIFSIGFGLIWTIGGARSRAGAAETSLVIDTFNRQLRFSAGGPVIVTPFADLEAIVIHETKTKHTESSSTRSGVTRSRTYYEYRYRIYFLKKDGAIIWVWTFTHGPDAFEHLRLLLERLELSCIDEAGGKYTRSLANPYTHEDRTEIPSETSEYLDITERDDGSTAITLRYERYGPLTVLGILYLLGILIGVPIWFFIANHPMIPGWFLVIPGVFLLFAAVGTFLRGRRYDVVCARSSIEVSVRFWFPIFQILLGKRFRINASALKAVRVNRYEEDSFHLELAVDREVKPPRLAGIAFNSGAVRMLPRAAVPDEYNHLGLWSVVPTAKRKNGPTVADLYVVEARMQTFYGLDPGDA